MLKMQTLAEKHPETYANLKKIGRPSIAEMMTRFARPIDIDRALGIYACAAHWVAGRNGASKKSEQLAREWLAKQDRGFIHMFPKDSRQYELNTPSIIVSAREPEPDNIFMVVCPADKAAKVSKVLDMMGCECVEI